MATSEHDIAREALTQLRSEVLALFEIVLAAIPAAPEMDDLHNKLTAAEAKWNSSGYKHDLDSLTKRAEKAEAERDCAEHNHEACLQLLETARAERDAERGLRQCYERSLFAIRYETRRGR